MVDATGALPGAVGTESTATGSSGTVPASLPSVSLPTGGGAIRGIDEKLSVGLSTGTAGLAVPVATTPARHGFGPALTLSYDSGAGNGPYGLGWRLSPASVTRKTSRGLPRYQDIVDSDTYVLSEAEDLVPALLADGTPDRYTAGGYTITRYRPRVEAAFTRVERWSDAAGEAHWRTTTRDNVTSVFGRDPSARVADPADPARVFSWLLELTYDALGNAVSYGYKAEDLANVPAVPAEASRTHATNTYLKQIRYAPTTPYDPAGPLPADWSLQVVFDYGEHDPEIPTPQEATGWAYRADAFSAYRAGFEVRTRRLCRRILMFHTFPELGDAPVLVASTDLGYAADTDPTLPCLSLLTSVTRTGWRQAGAGYTTRSMPPLELTYQPTTVDGTVRTVDADAAANLPAGVDGTTWQWADIDGEGIAGVLTADERAWYYRRNVSSATVVRFEPLRTLATRPAGTRGAAGATLVDLHGDGVLAAVDFAAPRPGYHLRTADGGWAPFTPLTATVTVDLADPAVRRTDLDGDGLADVLVTADGTFTWFAWSGDGFTGGGVVAVGYDEDAGPAVVTADPGRGVFLADMTGDGLADLVRVRNGEVCYWPNFGYGRFGAKVVMASAPRFDVADVFDARRLRLVDIDGTGTADIVYVGASGVRLWFNRSGNSFAATTALSGPAGVADPDTVTAVDLLGTGTGCLVWSTPLPGAGSRAMRYVDLLGGVKPHLLSSLANNLGARTTLEYATSTRFYLADRAAGQPWATKLAFPVHVVARREVADIVSAGRTVSTYTYHHGYFDGVEREFRGFAMVDQSDADFVAAASGTGTFTGTPPVDGPEYALPPARTRTWVHTGAYVGGTDIAAVLRSGFWAGDPAAPALGDTAFPADLAAEDMREACRALRGRVLRTEVYADDGTPQAGLPYAVTDRRYAVALIQPSAVGRYGSFVATDLEALTSQYERDPADPRTSHALTLAVDAYATVVKQATVAYPRRTAAYPAQAAMPVTYAEHDVVHVADQPDWYRIGVPVETREYELGGVPVPAPGGLLDPDALRAFAAGAAEIPYEQDLSGTSPQKRGIGRTRAIYRHDDLSGPLAAGTVESRALPDRMYRRTVTPGLATAAYDGYLAGPAATAVAVGDAGYVDVDGDGSWWAPSARTYFSPDPDAPDLAYATAHFFLPQGQVDPYGGRSAVSWAYDLIAVSATDAVGNTTAARVNYRLLRPWLAADANGNRTGVRYDELGMVVARAIMGKALATGDEADHLDTTTPEPSAGDDPTETLDYDLDALRTWAADPGHDPDHPAPVWTHIRRRVRHADPATTWLESYEYSDGFGRVALAKAQAEPGPAPVRDATGRLVRDSSGALMFADTSTRWVGSGRTVYDNKANPVKRYEPFFDSSPAYDADADLVEWGVTAIMRYDPIGRPMRVDLPDGTFTTVTRTPWRELAADGNDNVLASAWYAARSGGGLGADAADAAAKTVPHDDTPTVTDLDPLGRVFRTVSDGPAGTILVGHDLDVSGQVRRVIDAYGRTALSTMYDTAGGVIRVDSPDAGTRATIGCADGVPCRQWDSRGQQIDYTYDAARRPLFTVVTTGTAAPVRRAENRYGEGVPDDVAHNLRGGLYERRDGIGVVTTSARDFNGLVLSATRALVADPAVEPDWSTPPALAPETLTTTTTYDALRRVTSATVPDGSVTRPAFNERSLPLSVETTVAGTTTVHVTGVDYDPKGQRQRIAYRNGVVTTYTYDPQTFRLIRLVTTRPSGGSPVQDLTYVYDPVGNVTRSADAAQSTVYFANQLVAPVSDYTYDPVYRLVAAAGREHAGPPPDADDSPRRGLPLPADAAAMRNWTEAYAYDSDGDLTSVTHHATGGDWARTYTYDLTSHRLVGTQVGATAVTYGHDGNGNMDAMPHLASLGYDHRNLLRSTAAQAGTGPAPTTWYAYDSDMRRGRKSTTRADGSVAAERVYVGDYERYREFGTGGAVSLERHTLLVPDGTRLIVLVETTTVDTANPGAPAASTYRYQHADRIGSARVELDGAAAVISYEEYYPYGATSFQAGRSQAEVGLKRYRYTAREHDDENGFSYHGMRYYAPWLGRWTSADPAGLVDGVGVYSYSRGNPVRLSDPHGTDGDDDDNPPVPEAVPPPTSPISTNAITPTGTSSAGPAFNGSLLRRLSSGTAGVTAGSAQALFVYGMSSHTQLTLGVGPLISAQDTTPTVRGTAFNAQVQYDFTASDAKDTPRSTTFLVGNVTGNVATAGTSSADSLAATFTLGHEYVGRVYEGFKADDWGHPASQHDVNLTVGGALNAGALRANTQFNQLATFTAGYARTLTPYGYYADALPQTPRLPAMSSLPLLTVGYDVYATVGVGNLQVPESTDTSTGGTVTVGADLFGSFTSSRHDTGVGVGNLRATVGWGVGVFVTGDDSGPGGRVETGVGVRSVLIFTIGQGADVPEFLRTPQQR